MEEVGREKMRIEEAGIEKMRMEEAGIEEMGQEEVVDKKKVEFRLSFSHRRFFRCPFLLQDTPQANHSRVPLLGTTITAWAYKFNRRRKEKARKKRGEKRTQRSKRIRGKG